VNRKIDDFVYARVSSGDVTHNIFLTAAQTKHVLKIINSILSDINTVLLIQIFLCVLLLLINYYLHQLIDLYNIGT
jgi:hypothetical protein